MSNMGWKPMPHDSYSCSSIVFGDALGSVVVPSSVLCLRAFLLSLEGLAVPSVVASSLFSPGIFSVWRRGETGVIPVLLLALGDSPRIAFFDGLALAASDGLADAVGAGEAVASAVALVD